MKQPTDIKTGKTAVSKGVAKTLGYEAQLGVYSLLWREQQNPSEHTQQPIDQSWIVQPVRASSFWNVVDCPARWAGEHLDGKRKQASAPMHLGTTIHKATALFDQERVSKQHASVKAAIDCAVETLWHPEEEIDWGDETPRKLEPIARECTSKYCKEFSPKIDFAGVEETLADLAVDVPEVKVRIILTGTQDRLRRTIEAESSRDYGEIIGIRTTTNPEIAIGKILEPEKVLLGDNTHGGYLQWLAGMLRSGNLIGNPRSMFCSQKSCPIYPCFYARGAMK